MLFCFQLKKAAVESMGSSSHAERQIRLGLRENLGQFSLLVLINAFVGAMVGLERTILPLIAEKEFGLTSRTIILSFIVSFGITKALTNLFAGFLSDQYGRKGLLVLGWFFGLPVPFLVIFAPSWNWVVFANILLGINQGLCWSTAVVMKIDLVGPQKRGLAMGLNEFAGYLAVALAAFASGFIAAGYGLRPEPFYLGIAFVALGLFLSILFVHDTKRHVSLEARQNAQTQNVKSLKEIFAITSWRNRNLFSCSQAGLVNNLNDGMVWGLLPIFLASFKMNVAQIGQLTAIYPAVWGLLQIYTGAMSDRVGRKAMIVSGMWVQSAGILLLALSDRYAGWITGLIVLGVGTAQVYPTLLAAVGDAAHPTWRATSVGVYRFWRDSGYAIGAISSGIVADLFGMIPAILSVGCITFLSGIVVQLLIRENSP
jgi:MFS family permease